MRHPSKVGAFCARVGDRKLGGGSGPLRCGKHLKRGRKADLLHYVPWWMRLRSRRLRDARRAAQRRRS